jgi:DNA-binding CsgD family transcriptional regulator
MVELTESELKILKLICSEKSSQEIAEKIGFSTRSAERIKARLLVKTKAKSTIGLYKWAVKNKLVKP